MYFAGRVQAGRMLAGQIGARYEGSDSSILALSDGGVVISMQIAMQLHCPVGMLLMDEIELPRESAAIAGITQDGSFTLNHAAYSSGELDDMVSEYRGVIEQQKLEKLHGMHESVSRGAILRRDLLDNRNVILISDGLKNGFMIDMALAYLKRVPYKKLVVATPLASINAVDRIHVLADDIYCLSAVEDYIDTDHYYDTQDVPDHKTIVEYIAELLKNWK